MEADLFPKLGTRPIRKIEPPELLDVIRSIERRGAIVLARRMLQISGQVFRYAVAIGLATRDLMVPFVLLSPVGYFWRRWAITRGSIKFLWIWIACLLVYAMILGALTEV